MQRALRGSLALVSFFIAAPLVAQSVSEHAVLRSLGLLCLVAETDTGAVYVLDDSSGFVEGDRVFIEGDVTSFAACGNLVVPRLSNTIEAAFAGLGLLDLSGAVPCLLADGGGSYELESSGPFPDGARLFVQGVVRPGASGSRIEELYLGEGFQAFGRVFPTPRGWQLVTDSAAFDLERMGIFGVQAGDYAFVEGSLGPITRAPASEGATTGQPTVGGALRRLSFEQAVRHNTTQPALELVGTLLGSVSSGLSFQADGLVFDDIFDLEDFAAFQGGDEVFVRGRSLADYDPLEPRTPQLIRQSRIDLGLQTCGTIVSISSAGALLEDLDGEQVLFQNFGPFGAGAFVYLAGAVGPASVPVSLEHDFVLECWELPGTLELGFGCTPLFITDFPAGSAGNVFLLENLGGKQIGERFCAMGGISACEPNCSVPCLVANSVSDCEK